MPWPSHTRPSSETLKKMGPLEWYPSFADQALSVYRPVSACGLTRVQDALARPTSKGSAFQLVEPVGH